MSFKCDYCGDTAPKNTVCALVPVETATFITKEGTIGTKIVKELKRCVVCEPKTDALTGRVTFRLTPGERVAFTPPTAPARPGIARFDRE